VRAAVCASPSPGHGAMVQRRRCIEELSSVLLTSYPTTTLVSSSGVGGHRSSSGVGGQKDRRELICQKRSNSKVLLRPLIALYQWRCRQRDVYSGVFCFLSLF
jgi:hypothetical protein